MDQVLCFGELLLRYAPDNEGNWLRQGAMPVYIGGAEYNVAAALAQWGVPVSYCTALPQNYLSNHLLSQLQRQKIDASPIVYSGERIGAYFLPFGKDLKHTGVIYDRSGSSFSQLEPGSINWVKLLKDKKWFHFSAISASLTPNAAAVCLEAVKVARALDIPVSLDLNYRPRLWKYGKEPVEVMPELASYCTVLMGNIWSAHTMLGVPLQEEMISSGYYYRHAEISATHILERYPSCQWVANTFRFEDGPGIAYSATLFSRGEGSLVSREYAAGSVADKVGSGDCFMAGLIYGKFSGLSTRDTLEYATAAAFRKLQVMGDITTDTIQDIKKQIKA
ncbi:sugar kinase [Flavihumibacter rivuli]|uniref:sugar kinase n=1 Tax=Flavihumibacter rivuli TaxID=2838156 RepID=UPI001BDE75A2|nr:sugar kinase [Flavihumibacter rivuli]ULQ57000.1 sugar kinase [Flavihumibacter rivuli]